MWPTNRFGSVAVCRGREVEQIQTGLYQLRVGDENVDAAINLKKQSCPDIRAACVGFVVLCDAHGSGQARRRVLSDAE